MKERQSGGANTVLVTVCGVEGSSMRNPGTIMGVAEDGTYAGSLSGGCIETAVVAEAIDALRFGEPRITRFGAGSPYIDIKLPCGGGLDLHFQPLGDSDLAAKCLQSVQQRAPFSVTLSPVCPQHSPGWHPTSYNAAEGTAVFGHWPEPQLAIIGHGAGVAALDRLAHTLGCRTQVYTPDDRIAADLESVSTEVARLKRASETGLLRSDPWTAFAFLFHDHDWETDLIERALTLPHFYLGAMGGSKAHAARCEVLRARGVSDAQIAAIKAPIGVFHSSRDPQTLALSALAEIIRTYQETDFGAAVG
nr:XdhC family protein [Erythrobacter ani]